MFDIVEELKKIPEEPGVYLMFDVNDTIIYVGKAVNLKRRVRQYFDGRKNKDKKVLAMVSHIVRFEYIIVANEVEALVLESNLIKENRPKYNILLRDDKQYPYIKITDESFPRVLKTRRVLPDRALYFGPYPNAYAVNDIITLFHDHFKLRNCSLNFDKGQYLTRPCLNYFIHRCMGPCIGDGNVAEYDQQIEEIKTFLNGHPEVLRKALEEKMKDSAREQKFEQAAQYRDYIKSIDFIMEKQSINNTRHLDLDFIAMAHNEHFACVQVFLMRNGKVVEREHFIIRNEYEEDESAILMGFLQQYYLDMVYIPKLILISQMPNEHDLLEEMFSRQMGHKIELRIPQRGDKKDLLETAKKNAEDMLMKFLQKTYRKERNRQIAVEDLEKLIGVFPIRRIECYDISNIQGVQSTGSMIVFENGIKAPKEYRKFKIKTVEGPDDYRSHKEVLTRRFTRGLEERRQGNTEHGFGSFPDLILIDGGKGQVSVGLEVLQSLNLNIPLAGLIKDQKHRTHALLYDEITTPIKVQTALYKLLYQIQEEAHRFALNYHHKLRDKSLFQSELDEISGIGQARKTALLRHFGSVEEIKKQSLDQLLEVPKMTRASAEALYTHFHNENKE